MKILVDKMPKEKDDCPYCKDNFEEYICTWRNAGHYCTLDDKYFGCPYFAELKEKNYEDNNRNT